MNCYYYCYCYLINSFKNFKELRTLVSRAIRAIRVEKTTLLRRRNPPWQFDLSVEDFTPLRGRIHPRKVEAFTLFGGKKHPSQLLPRQDVFFLTHCNGSKHALILLAAHFTPASILRVEESTLLGGSTSL